MKCLPATHDVAVWVVAKLIIQIFCFGVQSLEHFVNVRDQELQSLHERSADRKNARWCEIDDATSLADSSVPCRRRGLWVLSRHGGTVSATA